MYRYLEKLVSWPNVQGPRSNVLSPKSNDSLRAWPEISRHDFRDVGHLDFGPWTTELPAHDVAAGKWTGWFGGGGATEGNVLHAQICKQAFENLLFLRQQI